MNEVMHSSPRTRVVAFEIEIEGKALVWSKPTITTEEIANLGGWDPAQGVIMVDRENMNAPLIQVK